MNSLMTKTTIVLLLAIPLSWACSLVPGSYVHWSMERIVHKQQIVLIGNVTREYDVPEDGRKDAIFKVECVLKNPRAERIPREITLHMVEPMNSCSGTTYKTNTRIILGVKRRPDHSFEYDEPNVTPNGAAFEATPENVKTVGKVCGMNKLMPPEGIPYNICPLGVPADAGCFDPTVPPTEPPPCPWFRDCGSSGVCHNAVLSFMIISVILSFLLSHW